MSRIETNKPNTPRSTRENPQNQNPSEVGVRGRRTDPGSTTGSLGTDASTQGTWVGASSQTEENLEDFQSLVEEVYGSCCRYFKQRPIAAAGALVAIGFYLGWKIRP